MKVMASACVLASVLSTGGRAETLSWPRAPAVVADDHGAYDWDASRIAVEVILGGAGTLVGVGAGFVLSGGKNLQADNFWLMAGIAGGAWLGTSLGGLAFGGGSHWMPSLIGMLCGSVASLAITGATWSSMNGLGVPVVTMVALPLLGSVIGYEVGQAMSTRSVGPLRRVGLMVRLAGDRQTLLPGIAGAF